MLLLEAENLKKYYSDRLIIELEHFKIYKGDRIGVVGLNGSGKTTLMDILSGRLKPDEGYVRHYCEIDYIRQFEDEFGDEYRDNGAADIGGGRRAESDGVKERSPMPQFEQRQMDEAQFEQRQMDEAQIEQQQIDEAQIEQRQIDEAQLSRKLVREFGLVRKLDRDKLSGGENTRLKIANAFSRGNVLLFADEPTSNLDYKGIELLREKLELLDSFMLISHDRSLLDALCNSILEVKDGKIRSFSGNFSFYRQSCETEETRKSLDYEKYIAEKEGLEAAIANRQQRSRKVRKAPARMGNSEARLHKRAANEKQEKLHNAANSLMTRLEKLEVREKPREVPPIKLDFSLTNPPENKVIISAEKLNFSYGSVNVFSNAAFKIYKGRKTALWGENGSGKTTLLNLVYSEECDRISIVPKARLAYFRQNFEHLDPGKSVLENVLKDSAQKEAAVRTILARLLLPGDSVWKKVAVLSGGEKIKTALAKLIVSKANVLLLDEPTNYLDMQSVEALESVLKTYEGTVVFVSHDRSFVNTVADRLLVLANEKIIDFDGRLEEYETQKDHSAAAAVRAAKTEGGALDGIERTLLQMRLTEVISKLTYQTGEKELLEEEYSRLVEMLRK